MRPMCHESDRTRGIKKSAKERAVSVDRRIRSAIDDLNCAGERVNISSVARRAQVSRQSIYAHTELRDEILRFRTANCGGRSAAIPMSQRSTADSSRERLLLLYNDNRSLRTEVSVLKKRLAELLGELRSQRSISGSSGTNES